MPSYDVAYVLGGREQGVAAERVSRSDGHYRPQASSGRRGARAPHLLVSAESLVKGDGKEYCIGAASVLAKVFRDRIMEHYDARWPGYGFAQHKGYPVPAHKGAVHRLGPCPVHRWSYAPIKHMCV